MIRFRNKNWELGTTRNMSLFQSCMDVAGHNLYSKNFGLPPLEHLFVVKNGTTMYAHVNIKNLDRYNKEIAEACLDHIRFKKIKAAYKKYSSDLLRASEAVEKNMDAKAYINYINANLNLSAGLYLTAAIGRYVHELLVEKMRIFFPSYNQGMREILISDITYPDKFTPLSQSRLDLLELCGYLRKRKIKLADIEKFPKAIKIFDEYYNKYYFIPVNFNEEPWTREDIAKQLKVLDKVNCKEEREKILRNHKAKIKKAKDKLAKIKNTEIEQMARSLQEGTMLNEYRKYVFCRASLAYRPLFKKIASENKLKDWKECWKLTPAEIFKLYFKKDKKNIQLIKNRNWAGIIFSDVLPGYKILKKNEIKMFIEEINSIKDREKISVGNEIKGMIANKGKTIGRARIILGKKDFEKFKDGDILVTAMTSVDFIPLMERSGAFVTNEGGITSHASIVSRELNKPCIIGTNIATKVLKDGDLVEVDADKGIVRIMNQTK